MELQWGRNFIVAEIVCPLCLSVLRNMRFNGAATLRCGNDTSEAHVQIGIASMGPQLYRCGNPDRHRRLYRCPDAVLKASMGPQLYRCGNERPRASMGPLYRCVYALALLQWGRNFIVAEMQSNRCRCALQGPQLYRCGNASKLQMGPQLYRCGNRPKGPPT